jgi:hypothetical protein
MDTFTSDYSSNIPTGITSNLVKSVSRTVKKPIKVLEYSSKHKQEIKNIQNILLKLAELLSKVD